MTDTTLLAESRFKIYLEIENNLCVLYKREHQKVPDYTNGETWNVPLPTGDDLYLDGSGQLAIRRVGVKPLPLTKASEKTLLLISMYLTNTLHKTK